VDEADARPQTSPPPLSGTTTTVAARVGQAANICDLFSRAGVNGTLSIHAARYYASDVTQGDI
jgi:hypothetical protein